MGRRSAWPPSLVLGFHKLGLSSPQGQNYVFLKTPVSHSCFTLDWNTSKTSQTCSKVRADLGDSHHHCSLGGREEGQS